MIQYITSNMGTLTDVPSAMGNPREDQFQGTWAERLIEIAGRVCYDSFGKGRSSTDFQQHLVDVGHTSVHQHVAFTAPPADLAVEANLPGVTICMGRVTANLRLAIEIERHTMDTEVQAKYRLIRQHLMPTVYGVASQPSPIIKPVYPEEKYVSLLMVGSRGFSHEQVRHHRQCAVSQRSTRYCDESTTPWIYHPLMSKISDHLGAKIEAHESAAKRLYTEIVKELQTSGVSRKQARGAARSVLGTALETRLVFTASMAQWKRMICQRMTHAADAEIRMIYNDVVTCLIEQGWIRPLAMEPAEDGAGYALAELHAYTVCTRKGNIMVLAADTDRAMSVAGVKPCDVISVEERV